MEIIVKVTQEELNNMGFDGYDLEYDIANRLDYNSSDCSGFDVNVEVIDD